MDDKRADAEERSPARGELERFVHRVAVRGAPLDRTRQLDLAAAEVFRAFATAQVDAVLLKGPALARLLYTDAEVRLYSDIDLLVAPPDLERARGVLADLGYANEGGDALGIRDVGGVVHAESWVITGPELADYQLIDLHSWLPGAKASAEDAWDCLVKRRTEVELCGELVPVLNRDGLAMHLALHAAQHGPSSPRGLDELELALERWSLEVWERAATLAAEIRAVERFAAGLRLVTAGAALAEVLALPSTDQLDWEIRNATARPRGTFHLQALLDKRGARERARVLRHALMPSRAWMGTEYRWAHDAGTPKLIAAYGVHLVSAPAWALRAWLYRRRASRAATRGTPPQ